MDILRLIYFALQSFSSGMISFLFDPTFIINPIVILIVVLMITQYRNIMSIQKQMYGGKVKYKLRDLVASSILAGILAGLAGSIIITVTGITFLKLTGLLTVIVVSLFLMFFVNPRYVCLAYSGGILSIFSLILGVFVTRGYVNKNDSIIQFFQNGLDFDVTSLMVIVAIMHLVEAVLMWFDGHRAAVPVFMKRNGKLVGGFVIQRLWVIPILFYILINSTQAGGQTFATPNWWPLFGPNLPKNELRNAVFGGITLLAMLGYSDFSMSTLVIKKVRRSSIGLFGYSILLLIMAILSSKLYIFKYIAAIFAVIGHEGLILYERYRESTGSPLWDFAEDGIIVLDTIPESPAEKIGIKSGDKIININDKPVRLIEDVMNIMNDYVTFMWIEIINLKGEKRLIEYSNYQNGIKGLGVITVPRDDNNVIFVEEANTNLLKKLKDRFKK